MRRHNPCLILMISLAVPCMLGGVVSFFGGGRLFYAYQGLNLPKFAAPVWAFSPVWWLLYLFMGFAVFLVWQQNRPGVRGAVLLYCAGLLLLPLWPLLFFGFEQYFAAAILLAVHILLVLITMRQFFLSNFLSGALLLPYPIWLGYLFYLNLGIAYFNR